MKTYLNVKTVIASLGILVAGYAQAQTTTTNQDNQSQLQQSQNTTPEIDNLKKQLEAKPDDTQLLVDLATAYQNNSDWTSAIATWQKITTLIPDWAPAYYSIGYANQSAKNTEGAKMAYEQFINKIKPTEVEANKQNLAYAYFFVAFADKDTNPEKAKQYIAKSLQYDKTNQDAINLSKSLMN